MEVFYVIHEFCVSKIRFIDLGQNLSTISSPAGFWWHPEDLMGRLQANEDTLVDEEGPKMNQL
jgi:hypothetical protein